MDIHKARVSFEDITRRLTYPGAEDLEGDSGGSDAAGEEDEEWDSEEVELDENQRKLMEFLAKKQEEEKDFILDYDSIISELDG